MSDSLPGVFPTHLHSLSQPESAAQSHLPSQDHAVDIVSAGAGEVARARTPTAAAPESTPRIVTTGGKSPLDPSTLAKSVLIDWLAFTVIPPEDGSPHWVVDHLRCFLPDLAALPTGKGWNGYKQRYDLQHGTSGASLGLLAHGGESQRGSVHAELNAQACALIADWSSVQAWGEQHRANITRVDLAHDDYTGQTISVETGLAWHRSGQFNSNGRPAKARLIDDLGTGDGKTLYVGNRAYGKMLRIYEKGKQLGDPDSLWVRVEVELHNKSRVIPWVVLEYPGYYLAGAYPCLAYLAAEQRRIETIRKAVSISLDASVHHLRQTGGKLLNLMMHRYDGDAFAVINELKRDGVPRRLASYAAFLPDALDESFGA